MERGFEIIDKLKPQPSFRELLVIHIPLLHSKSGEYKKVLFTSEPFYLVVTRVNYSTCKLWLEHRNRIIKERKLTHMDIYQKPNWLCMEGWFRRKQDELLNTKIDK